ncbi:MAG: heparan-alpha-glucosaminide N-acetyltransferase domain-containing protein [Gemmatimonadaceae bacterium]
MISANTRVGSIDVLRGITIAAMLLVNDPGDADNVFTTLRHSPWNGCTFADFVFPFFLFLVGVTTHLSQSRRDTGNEGDFRRAIFRRAVILFGLGLFLNAFPFYENSLVAGPQWMPAFVGHIIARFAHLRIMGVLQRISICYVVVALITQKASVRSVVAMIAVLLIGYWCAMTLLPVPGEIGVGAQYLNDPAHNLSSWLDRTLLDWTRVSLGWHLYDPALAYDPEGLLSTIPAIATVLLGVLAGRWMQSPRTLGERLLKLSMAGLIAIAIGAAWGVVFPINKPLWTSSYVIYTAGTACLSLGVVGWVVDYKGWRRWTPPFLVFGTNAILAYVGGELLASILRSTIKFKVDGHRLSTGMTVVRGFEGLGAEARVASALWAIVFVVICYALLRPLYKKRIFLKV